MIPEVPSRGSVGASGDLAPLAHLALPLVGEDERAFRASCSPGRMRSPGPGWSRCGCRRRKGSRSSTARSSWARSRRSGSCGRRGSRRPRTSPALCRSTRSRARERASSAASTSCVPLPGPGRVGREHPPAARRLGDRRGPPLVRPRPGRVLAALRRPGARRVPGPARLRRAHRRRRAERGDRQPARLRRRGDDVSNGNFHGQPVAFALDALAMAVSELASISERRTERLVNPRSPTVCPRSSRPTAGSTPGS